MTKETVLSILRTEKGYVSGEKISTLLGISRAAINTAVKSLRLEGYEILSSTGKGYLLVQTPDSLTPHELSVYLPKERLLHVQYLETVDSTNSYLRNLAFHNAPNGQVILADEQSGGRGRKGRSFFSPKNHGIYLSMLFRPTSMPSDTITLTAWTAVAVNNAIEKVCGIRAGIKWVNDLIVNHHKVCGILTEMSVESESGEIQHVIIGVGLNVNETRSDFPDELSQIASSLSQENGVIICRARLAAEIINQLDRMCRDWPDSKQYYLDTYRKDDLTVGQSITFLKKQETKAAKAISITDSFALRVQYPDGKKEDLQSGEVHIQNFY